MSVRSINVCDVPRGNGACGKSAKVRVDVKITNLSTDQVQSELTSDVCNDDIQAKLQKALAMVGITLGTVSTSSAAPKAAKKTAQRPARKATTKKATAKKTTPSRKTPSANGNGGGVNVMRTASGKDFTAADARAYLVEQGDIPEGAVGRLSQAHMEKYAAAH